MTYDEIASLLERAPAVDPEALLVSSLETSDLNAQRRE